MLTTLELPKNESQRIEVLKSHNILDTPPDGSFDRITRLAATIFDVPISIISLVDTDRIWFKSHYGLDVNQINRDPGLCASAILTEDTYVVENAIEDPRTLANPLVAGEFGLRFYAAAPLQTQDNYNLGTLCVIDRNPRQFSEKEKEILRQLAALVIEEMDMRLSLRNTVHKIKKLTSDIAAQLNITLQKVSDLDDAPKAQELKTYLDASRNFLQNLEGQLSFV